MTLFLAGAALCEPDLTNALHIDLFQQKESA